MALIAVTILISHGTATQAFERGEKPGARDKYQSLDELKQALQEGKDFRIVSQDRGSAVTIAAPHGGSIEPYTSQLTALIAGNDYNVFSFEGLWTENVHDLHVTATHFRDPQLDALLSKSRVCVAVHGRRGNDETIWLGGLNEKMSALMLKKFKECGFAVDPDPPALKGTSAKNVVNLTSERGVQLELPEKLRDDLRQDPKRRDAFVKTVRKAIAEYFQ